MGLNEIKKQAETGGSADLVWYLTRVVMSGLLVLLVIGLLLVIGTVSCGTPEKVVDAATENVIEFSVRGNNDTPAMLQVGDCWRHVTEDVTIVIKSIDSASFTNASGITINGSYQLSVTMDQGHFVEAVASNGDYKRVSGVHR